MVAPDLVAATRCEMDYATGFLNSTVGSVLTGFSFSSAVRASYSPLAQRGQRAVRSIDQSCNGSRRPMYSPHRLHQRTISHPVESVSVYANAPWRRQRG